MDENRQLRLDEITALDAIIGDQMTIEDEQHICLCVKEKGDKSDVCINLDLSLPLNYPTAAPPDYILSAPYLSPEDKESLRDRLQQAYLEAAGQPIIYRWFEIVSEFLCRPTRLHSPQRTNDIAPERLEPSPSDVHPTVDVKSGDPLVDRKSTFQAHVAKVISRQQVQTVLEHLKSNAKIARATHNMYAYRIQTDNGNWLQDCDDDGESQAGSRLLHLLEVADVRNVLVVVSRWYGGIMLGPDRFKHINNVARDMLEAEGFIKPKQPKTKPTKRR